MGLPTPTASPDFRAARPTSSAVTIRMRGRTVISSGRPSISAATLRKSMPTSISSPAAQTANRLVLTVGKFFVIDMFDTNKYANNDPSDFLNWSVINTGTFDFGRRSPGAIATVRSPNGTWETGPFRGGLFDMSQTRRRRRTVRGYGLDPTFQNFEWVGEIEYRYRPVGTTRQDQDHRFSHPRRHGKFYRAPLRSPSDRPGCQRCAGGGARPITSRPE